MKVLNIKFDSGTYTIEVELDSKETIDITGKIVLNGDFDEDVVNHFNFLTEEIKESKWINDDEYLIPFTCMYEVPPDEVSIPLGILRYYITCHMNEEFMFELQLKNKPEEMDANKLAFALFDYLHWEM